MIRCIANCLVACVLLFVLLAGHAAGQSSDLEQIEATIGHYFAGHATGDGAHHEQAFHPKATLFWVRDGALHERPSAEYIAAHKGQPPQDEAQRQRRIVSIDISGTAALVKVELDYPGALIHDYMSMLKIDGRWQIINKTFVVHPREEG